MIEVMQTAVSSVKARGGEIWRVKENKNVVARRFDKVFKVEFGDFRVDKCFRKRLQTLDG